MITETARRVSKLSSARRPRIWSLLPLVLLPLVASWLGRGLSPWILMWGLAVAIYAALKWLTWWRAGRLVSTSWRRALAYLLLWPGMDARSFLNLSRRVDRPSPVELAAPLASVGLGAVLFWGVARLISGHGLIQGWLGLVGLVFLLHFGAFRLVSAFWRWHGIDAEPLMHAPLRARSLGEFWSTRWNTAFHVLARDLVVAPLRPRLGMPAAIMAAFLASGLVHELVISVPARAGFGLPTAYFLLQGFGLLLERSQLGRSLGLGRGIRGRGFALVAAGAPAFGLFHPAFVLIVIVPFMRSLGAL